MIALKIFIWLKSYWWIPLGLVTAVILFFIAGVSGKDGTFRKVLDLMSSSRDKQKTAFSKIDREKEDKKKEITERYIKQVEELEKRYRNQEVQLSVQKKRRIMKLSEDFQKDPEKAARLFAAEFGLFYVK